MSAFNTPLFNRIIFPLSFVSTLAGGVILLKEYKGGRKCPSKEQMKEKVCVITGANVGIGKSTAEELARRGATVVMGCRHIGKCERAAREIRMNTENSNVVCRFIDLADLHSVEEFAGNVRKELPHIDVLINNAGVMKPRPPKTTPRTKDNFERQFGVNYLGHFLLTHLLSDKMTNDRVINLSSEAYSQGEIDINDIDKSKLDEDDEKLSQLYYQSKLAVMLFTEALSRKQSNITVNAVNTGLSSTQIGRHSKAPIYALGMHIYRPFQWIAMKTPVQAAQTSIYLSVAAELEKTSGSYFHDCQEISKVCDLKVCNSKLSDELWEASEKWTNMRERLNRIKLMGS
ncbi:retinol dehydrogenase 13-like isoform X1 [Styela clava]